MTDSGLTDLDKKWFDFTSAYVTKLSKTGGHDWDSLSEEEQELAALWKLEMDMYNGGFIQFFCNWGYDCYTHAVRCLTKLQANECLDIITQQYSIIERLGEDDRLTALWDIPKYLTEEETKALDELDHRYWDNTDSIQEKTFQVYGYLQQ
ncbi:DMP19 family protein [Xanthocytophaga agilis]|uniref:DUF4375 domain-containing protein n=1 Tax=Xanthocytophaga agilis TaxID=3048010 RepID=A0AAE3R7C8_9BACT|nr:DUF4375 domain-containing protein [Xanthocytophaga agilis]MDJ1502809.1 DUF4375 domain-containing protein [Xanthocytophaga agilis]